METIRLNGRVAAGFGLGAVAEPMTVQEAATVSQGWGVPALKGALPTMVGTFIGGAIGNLSTGDRYLGQPGVIAGLTALGMFGGAVVGAGVGGIVAARFGRRQDQAAAVLAQAQQTPSTT